MVLTKNWTSSTANSQYFDVRVKWQVIDDVPLEPVNCPRLENKT